MTEEELSQLKPGMRTYALQDVTLEGVTKPLHEWATERKLTIKLIRERRVNNSWAESLVKGSIRGNAMKKKMWAETNKRTNKKKEQGNA